MTAHAGTWQARANDPVYSCTASPPGNVALPPGTGPDQHPSTVTGGGASLSITGTASFQWTWVPAYPSEPPPLNVIMTENVSTGMIYYGGSGVLSPPGTTKYEVKDSSSGTVSLSVPVGAAVTFSGGSGGGLLFVYANASPASVLVTLGGTAKDSSYSDNILIGQHCAASLSPLPSALLNNTANPPTYKWSVSGTTFQSWSVVSDPNNQSHTAEADGYGPATNSTASWYWNDPNNAAEIVTCTATITPPNGQGGPFSVTATQKVTVYVPGFTFNATPGYIQINTKAPNQGGALDLYAGGLSGGPSGVAWTATCTTPPLFGKGNVELIQIATPNLSYTEYAGIMKVGPQHNDPQNGQTGLDGQCPYPGSSYTEGSPTPFTSNDSPTAPLSNSIGSIIMTHQFTDYLMYIPPGSSQVVPLATLTWGLNMTGSAIIPATVNWADYTKQHGTDSAGTVTTTTQQATNKFPKWTLIDGPLPINSF